MQPWLAVVKREFVKTGDYPISMRFNHPLVQIKWYKVVIYIKFLVINEYLCPLACACNKENALARHVLMWAIFISKSSLDIKSALFTYIRPAHKIWAIRDQRLYMTYFQDNSQFIAKTSIIDVDQVVRARKQLTNSILSVVQVLVGVALLAISTHLAVESERYLSALNQSGLNQYHAFALLVCVSFFAGILLIAQQVLQHDTNQFDGIWKN